MIAVLNPYHIFQLSFLGINDENRYIQPVKDVEIYGPDYLKCMGCSWYLFKNFFSQHNI